MSTEYLKREDGTFYSVELENSNLGSYSPRVIGRVFGVSPIRYDAITTQILSIDSVESIQIKDWYKAHQKGKNPSSNGVFEKVNLEDLARAFKN